MIHHKDQTFCATSGTCANTDCPRWIDFGQSYDLPLALAELKGTDQCAGFVDASGAVVTQVCNWREAMTPLIIKCPECGAKIGFTDADYCPPVTCIPCMAKEFKK